MRRRECGVDVVADPRGRLTKAARYCAVRAALCLVASWPACQRSALSVPAPDLAVAIPFCDDRLGPIPADHYDRDATPWARKCGPAFKCCLGPPREERNSWNCFPQDDKCCLADGGCWPGP